MKGPEAGRAQLSDLFPARLEQLKQLAAEHDLPRSGGVEQLRARVIEKLVLGDWVLDWSSIQSFSKRQLTQLLATFGIKRSGSIKEQKQRLWLHLNHEPKKLALDILDNRSRDELHDLCIHLGLPRSGSKSQLFGRVAGVLASQEGGWGKVKRSLRRGTAVIPTPPVPDTMSVTTEDPEVLPEFEETVLEAQPAQIDERPHVPGTRMVSEIDQEADFEAIEVAVSAFTDTHGGAWSDAEEAALYGELSRAGHPVHLADVSRRLHELLERGTAAPAVPIPEIPKTPPASADPDEQNALVNLDSRMAELDHAIRDFLLDGDISDQEDVAAFLTSLKREGIPVEMPLVRRQVIERMNHIEQLLEVERNSISTMPHSWRERHALRRLEDLRMHLLKELEEIFREHPRNLVKARMAFEKFASEQELDLRLASVSGRLHGLFDLHVSLNSHLLGNDPRAPRREKALRILNHEAMDLDDVDRSTLERIEQNIEGFEHVVEAILSRNPGEFDEDQQILLIRFLEQRGYDVDRPDMRPRVLAAAGILGAEFGHIDIEKVPRVGPAGLVSEAQVNAVVADLKRLATTMAADRAPVAAEDPIEEPTAGAVHRNRLDGLKHKLDSVDDLLNRIGSRGL